MAGKQMQLEDWLDDLCVRFVINLPQEDLSSVARICFQVEEAQWFYEDFIRPLDPTLPSMSLRTFCLRIFKHCPLLASFPVEVHIQAFEEFLQYKTRVPVRGAIMLNHAMDSVVLVKGWKKGANWSFPRGKINKDEDDLDCAVREVYEETGLDLREAGLVPTGAKPKYIEISMREQHLRLYVFRDVPMDTKFQPRTRKEISKIEWYKLSDLPTLRKKGGNQNHAQYDSSGPGPNANKFYMVAPFLVPLKKWIVSQKKAAEKRITTGQHTLPVNQLPIEEEPTEDEAWTNDATTKAQAFESFDGATRELQRLLNVQPQADAPPVENKASALLSLLQPSAGASSRPVEPQSHPQLPHLLAGFNMAEAGQPRSSHHHPNNMQHGPPDPRQPASFPLPSNQAAPGWDAAQSQSQSQTGAMPPQILPGFPNYTTAPSYPPAYHGGPPTHLPAQQSSQATIFGGRAFQDGPSQTSLPQAPAHIPSGIPSGMPHQALPFGQPGQIMPQPRLPARAPRQVPLNGQALALLNAFKQGPAAPVPGEPKGGQQRAQQLNATHNVDPQQPSPYSEYAVPQRIPSVHVGPKAPSELAGSAVGPARQDQHKSALLDLFKKPQPEAPAERSVGKQDGGKEVVVQPPAPAEKELWAQPQPPAHVLQRPPQAQAVNQSENLAMDRLSVRKSDKRANKPASSNSPVRNKASGKSPRTSRNAKPTGPQPTRILQRGESLQALDADESKPEANVSASPDFSSARVRAGGVGGNAAQPRSVTDAGPSIKLPLTTQQQQQQQTHPPTGITLNYQMQTQPFRPDVSQEQKRQLLSLFGAPAQAAIRREPSRAGSSAGETPISPADQTFLLDYLQSVTNNAGR